MMLEFTSALALAVNFSLDPQSYAFKLSSATSVQAQTKHGVSLVTLKELLSNVSAQWAMSYGAQFPTLVATKLIRKLMTAYLPHDSEFSCFTSSSVPGLFL